MRLFKRHLSGRAIALVAEKGPSKVAVVSLYLPSGLDNAAEHSQRHVLATQLLEFAAEYTREYPEFVIGGDLNETRKGGLDRRMGGVAPDPRKNGRSRATCVLERFLGGVGARCADLYRTLHPTEPNYTHF